MRRLPSAVIVGLVVVIAVLAAADAIRGRAKDEVSAATTTTAPTTTRPGPPSLREILRVEAVNGFVTYSDRDCVLHTLLLPRMLDQVVRHEDGPPFRLCRFGEGGGRYLAANDLPSPNGTLVARCDHGYVKVWELESGVPRETIRGCPAAWRPDGVLTYARGDAIYAKGRPVLGAGAIRFAARQNPAIAGLDPHVPVRVRIVDFAWLGPFHTVVSLRMNVRGVGRRFETVLFVGDTPIGLEANLLRGWVVSDAGTYAASREGFIVGRDGDFTPASQGLTSGEAVEFSPDEQWLAYATGVSIYLIGTPRGDDAGRVIRLPVPARDLVWEAVSRGTAVGPPVRR